MLTCWHAVRVDDILMTPVALQRPGQTPLGNATAAYIDTQLEAVQAAELQRGQLRATLTAAVSVYIREDWCGRLGR